MRSTYSHITQLATNALSVSIAAVISSTIRGRIFARRVDPIARTCRVQPPPPCAAHSDAAVVSATSLSWCRLYCQAGKRILGYIESTKIWKHLPQRVRDGQTQQRAATIKGMIVNLNIRLKDSQSFQRAAAGKRITFNPSHRLRDDQSRQRAAAMKSTISNSGVALIRL